MQGKVIDANSGDAISFVNVIFKWTSIGTTTDFDGNFLIRTALPVDSIEASYIGYKPRTKNVKRGLHQTINFQLNEEVTSLEAVVVTAGENPAWKILRGVVRNKQKKTRRYRA